jgi:hypothetical protein
MVNSLSLKPEVLKTAEFVFNSIVPGYNPELVLPKNRRKRTAGNPSKYLKRPVGVLKTLEMKYGAGLTTKKLVKLCKQLGIDVPHKDSRAKASLLLFSTVYPDEKLINSEVPIETAKVLIIIYVSMLYCYSDSQRILVGDILDWAYTGTIPYFTAYSHLNLPSELKSLFKPLSLPSSHWIRKEISMFKIDCINTFLSYYQFIFQQFVGISNLLGLPLQISQLGYKLFMKSWPRIATKKSSKILPVIYI